MLRLKIQELRELGNLSVRQLSEATGIRWNTLSDMERNIAKHWPPEHLDKLMSFFKLNEISQLIEYEEEPPQE
ncbi:helix-turn-helix domain-containing protein [Paenibacillus monticola]|uniref:Helix-turn-helix domain-containing protein n=1 Tax=Paenibacillus monticola TaxID=2666075 RepID=A0A7X2L076_9BACL|nr:helix-turn-helix transcriptional regulator [Paenibacillus monticola]MRN52014.1 helix-turn-helix domain-containing protein [Paenibacillus monticola]